MKLLIYGSAIGIVFEVITLILRFGFDLESTRDTALIGSFIGGVRFHHGCIGILLISVAYIAMWKGKFVLQDVHNHALADHIGYRLGAQ